MKENYTHIVLLIDRSGSMSSIKSDMEGGIREFIENQKTQIGDCTITAVQFDDRYDVLFVRKPISEIVSIDINPRGMTALTDSMCRLIKQAGEDLAGLDESERPEKVLFVTITDGQENASHEYTNEQLSELIKEQEDKYNWNFTYIGANQDAFAVANQFGGRVDNTLNYAASSSGVKKMFSKLSDATSRLRGVSLSNLSKDSFQYTEDERNDI